MCFCLLQTMRNFKLRLYSQVNKIKIKKYLPNLIRRLSLRLLCTFIWLATNTPRFNTDLCIGSYEYDVLFEYTRFYSTSSHSSSSNFTSFTVNEHNALSTNSDAVDRLSVAEGNVSVSETKTNMAEQHSRRSAHGRADDGRSRVWWSRYEVMAPTTCISCSSQIFFKAEVNGKLPL